MFRKRNISFSIKITIFALFSVFTLITMGIIITLNYTRNSTAALLTAEELMDQNVHQVFMKIENLYEPLLNITDQASELPIFGEKPTLQNHPAESYLINSIEAHPQIQVLYMGYSDGDFYEILSFKGESRTILQENVNAPENAEYGILRQYTPEGQKTPVRLWKFLNNERQTISSLKQGFTGYNPQYRPWYINAQKTDSSVKTDPYFFTNIMQMGITISRKLDGKVSGVIGADILSNEMSRFLSEITGDTEACIFIFNEKMQATSLPHHLKPADFRTTPYLTGIKHPLIKIFLTEQNKMEMKSEMDFQLEAEGKRYLVKIRQLPDRYSNGEYLFMARPREEILGPISDTLKTTSLLSLIILLLTLPIILIISNKISNPINKLVKEASKIGNFELTGDITINTNIKETNRLTKEMASMKRGLRQFNKYVPSRLVRTLLESNMESRIGGETKEMTFFFSDIANFTNISETIPPEILMKRLSCYFDILTQIIKEHNGTVDKYIGDAVMAFWNAPHNDPDHIKNGCIAAIRIQQKLSTANRIWNNNGQSSFHTRIGVHTGEAVVGNVGSRERLNYTVIGDAVNVSSRFESLNKRYKTKIIVGESLIEKLDADFLYRPLEKIIVKGKTSPELIFELISLTDEAEIREIEFAALFNEAYQFYLKREWSKAEIIMKKALLIKPEDNILNTYLNNINLFKQNEPEDDWTGIHIMKDK